MRATGIVRRIDELGRVVIPKEIRRTLRIREGDPLEIYTDRDGEVILKKFSPVGELSGFAKDFTDSLNRTMGHIACVCDKDMIVATTGAPKKELVEKAISPELENIIAARQIAIANASTGARMISITAEGDEGAQYTSQVVAPIISDGEAVGAILLLSKEAGVTMSDIEVKVAETAAGFVGRQMEQ